MYLNKQRPLFWSFIQELLVSLIKLINWLCALFTSNSNPPKPPKANFSSLPGELIEHILSFLSPYPFLNGVIIPKKQTYLFNFLFFQKVVPTISNHQVSAKLLFLKIKETGLLSSEHQKTFYKLISTPGRMTQALQFLEHQQELINHNKAPHDSIQKLISNKCETIVVNDLHMPVSAYGYAFFTYQNEKQLMLETFLNSETKSIVEKECATITYLDYKRQISDDIMTKIMLAQSL